MFSWIGKLFGHRTAVEQRRGNPVLDKAVQRSAEIYAEIPLGDLIDEDRRSTLARELYLELNQVCNSTEPATACRDRFVEVMLQLAALQVLVIPAPPAEDPSGLRDEPGVTGELQKDLVRICAANDDLRSLMYAETESEAFDDLWTVVERLYWETYWLAASLNGMRVILEDNPDRQDWFLPFLHAACVRIEHIYRLEADLPPAFDVDIARDAATTYSVFTDIVISGAADPVAEWREYAGGTGTPMPDFRG